MQEACYEGSIVDMVAEINAKITKLIEKNFSLNLECDGLKTELEEITTMSWNLVRGLMELHAENSKLRE